MLIETFRKRALGQIDAGKFLAEHRDFLCGFKSIVPVLALLEKKIIFPTPALVQILTLIALEKDPNVKGEEVVNKKTGVVTVKSLAQVEAAMKKSREPKKYQLFLFVKEGSGENCIETYDAMDYGEATRIAHRKLFHREDSVYVDVVGLGVTTRISRDDAVREILRGGIGGRVAVKKMAKSTSSLGWKCSGKNFVAKFSRG